MAFRLEESAPASNCLIAPLLEAAVSTRSQPPSMEGRRDVGRSSSDAIYGRDCHEISESTATWFPVIRAPSIVENVTELSTFLSVIKLSETSLFSDAYNSLRILLQMR